jgi:hypothetical protein
MKQVNQAALFVLLLVLGVRPILGKEASLTQDEIKDGWILLFDGETLFGLSREGQSTWKASDGVLSADGTGVGYIRTTSPFSDFVLKMDFRLSNSAAEAALYIRTAKDSFPIDNGYQVRIGDGNPNWPAGSIVPRFKANAMHPQAGQWHSLEIDADGKHITVLLDHKTIVDGKDSSARAGYIGFKVSSGSMLEIRNIKLKPINSTALFNGTDLAGWKTATPAPKPEKPSKLKKLIPFGIGKPKVIESAWSVQAGMIHGEKGPGQLETVAAYDDFVLQFAVPLSATKQQGRHALSLRGDTGKTFTGYEITMDADNPGAILPNLAAPRKILPVQDLTMGTVVVSGRHLAVWVNGFPVTEFTDTRPEGASAFHNARTSAGVIGLPLHDASATADYAQIRLTSIANALGGIAGKTPPPTPAPAAVVSAAPAVITPVMPISPEARQQTENRNKTARLMSDALKSTNPAEQMRRYDQVIQLDPTNVAAAAGYKEAKETIDKQQADAEKQREVLKQKEVDTAALNDALNKAQSAFLSGNLRGADTQMAIAERIAPTFPAVLSLRQKIDSVRAQNGRIRYLLLGGGLFACGGLASLFYLRRRKKHGFLEVVSGAENGRRYDLDQPVTRIGAIAQDGDHKNDIVLGDLRHMISRFHCEVYKDNGKFYLVDCNSANGTCVDRREIPPDQFTRLKNGARIELGGTITLLFGLEKTRRNPGVDPQLNRGLHPANRW